MSPATMAIHQRLRSNSDTVSILVVTPAVGVTLDLDDSGAGTGFSTIFNEDGAAVPNADTDAIIGTASLTIASATIVLTNGQPGNMFLVGSLPLSIASSNYDTATGVLTLTGTSATVAEFQTALSQITFSNSTQNPEFQIARFPSSSMTGPATATSRLQRSRSPTTTTRLPSISTVAAAPWMPDKLRRDRILHRDRRRQCHRHRCRQRHAGFGHGGPDQRPGR